ncbi:hypothetical protein LPTSP4_23340 [Leptospira ryugenii]|uniref:Uncharacterized protein n=1 Tax=Leptospira ryugenii TaxID=1917863 RepID=A0A2P2E1P2_9LEPT|nr:hypothetical protein [Leptospira ryugenii]GBF50807.1 hypothetical protein LPTSP4_23340 [Leptospira ryugenii]
MSPGWKTALQKEKDQINYLVYEFKKSSPNLEIGIQNFFLSYYKSISMAMPEPKSDEDIVSSFHILVSLVQKGVLKESGGAIESLFFNILSKMNLIVNDGLSKPISYLINAASKLETSKQIKFFQQIDRLITIVSDLKEFSNTLVCFVWLNGRPEYRKEAIESFANLSLQVQEKIRIETKLQQHNFPSPYLDSFFGPFLPNLPSEFRYKLISGHPLLGGEMKQLPEVLSHNGRFFILSGNQSYELFFDSFGSSLFPTSEWKGTNQKSIQSKIWKVIQEKFFPEQEILSVIENEQFLLLTIQYSYQIYLFYRVNQA